MVQEKTTWKHVAGRVGDGAEPIIYLYCHPYINNAGGNTYTIIIVFCFCVCQLNVLLLKSSV